MSVDDSEREAGATMHRSPTSIQVSTLTQAMGCSEGAEAWQHGGSWVGMDW